VRALYVSPIPYGANAAVDAISHGLDSRLAERGIELRVRYADFADPRWREQADLAVRAGADAGFDVIVIWVTDPVIPAGAVGYARARGVPVVSLERPRFGVDASLVYPNFNHGAYTAEHLATLLPPGGRVAVAGGPDVVDDIELLLGIVHGLAAAGLTRVNDPEDPRYKNTTDVAAGGKEKPGGPDDHARAGGRVGPVAAADRLPPVAGRGLSPAPQGQSRKQRSIVAKTE